MNVSDLFKTAVSQLLNEQVEKSPLLAQTLAKEGKNLDDCCTYILNEVKKTKCMGFADEEILNMALHYYDEDNITVGNRPHCRVVVNQSIPAAASEPVSPKALAQPAEEKPAAKKNADKKSAEPTESLFSLFASHEA